MTERYAAFDQLLFDRPAAHVLRVTINNPAQANAITPTLQTQLHSIWAMIDNDPETRVTIITGSGRHFSAGGSLGDMPTGETEDKGSRFNFDFGNARELVQSIINARKPIVSAINGPAIGAGLAVALLADIPIAAKQAKLIDGHLRIGVLPGDHAAMIWPLLCGIAKAKFYLMTNRSITGEMAEAMNLVALSVDAEDLQAEAVQVATELANTAPTALRMTKYVLNHFLRQNQTVFDLSAALEMANFGSAESNEAMRAFIAKETPDFPEGRDFK
ncbi:MAG: enoyl-CoA hydratase/isomerase family protein [Sphingorhabdus sp.]